MAEPKRSKPEEPTIGVDLADELPITESELDLIESYLGDLLAELMSKVPEETN